MSSNFRKAGMVYEETDKFSILAKEIIPVYSNCSIYVGFLIVRCFCDE
jgi:hypothetical protein